jgi:molecular chaperone GrpE
MNEDRSTEESTERVQAPSEDDGNGTIEDLRRQAEDHWNKYLRTVAELDNFRKRSAREVENARKFGAERLAQAILPVRDSIEAGLAASASANADPTLIDGQQATLRLLDDALSGAGIREIDPKGEPFDPNKHEALSLMPAPGVTPNTVLEVVQKGFEMNERLLRAAKVIVAR